MTVHKRRKNDVRSASKPSSPINRFRGAFGDKKNWGKLRGALDAIKNDGPKRDFEKFYKLAKNNPLFSVVIPSSKAVKSIVNIQATMPLDTIGVNQELAWVSTILRSEIGTINKFVSRRDEYTKLFCSGEYSSALSVLEEIEREFGFSLWCIENKISLLSLESGFEKQKLYVNSIATRNKRSFAAFFASHIGERNEARVSKHSFEIRLVEKSKSWNIRPEFLTYIYYKLLREFDGSEDSVAKILSYEAGSSVIDLYETFVDLLSGSVDLLESKASQVVLNLNKLDGLNDMCIKRLVCRYSGEYRKTPTVDDYLNEFYAGNYTSSASLTSARLLHSPDDPVATFVAAKLKSLGYEIDCGSNKFVGTIVGLLSVFMSQGAGSGDAAMELDRLSINTRSLSISWSISNSINSVCVDSLDEIVFPTAVRTAYSSVPVCVAMTGGEVGASVILSASNSDSSCQYFKSAYSEDVLAFDRLSNEAFCYSKISFYKRIEKPGKALDYIDRLGDIDNSFLKQDASVLRAWFLYESGDVFSAIEHSVGVAVGNTSLLRSLPIVKIFETRGFRDLKQLENNLSLSIGFYFYITLAQESTKEVSLKVAWKQFHRSHQLSKPSDIKIKSDEFDQKELVFFLRNVCTQEIMELSSEFNSPSDLERERLKICIALSELDPENVSAYNGEIIELTRRLSIEDGVQQVESSRVYVDLSGLQRWCRQNLNDKFLRYLDYAAAGLQASNEDLERSIVAILKNKGVDVELISFLDGYDINADTLLVELIEECANKFLTLPRFGLDAFLGSRVRHGSLEGAFRTPLEARKLITKRDSNTNQYENNHYWFENNPQILDAQASSFYRILNLFSSKIDSLLDIAISKSVYVNSPSNAEGIICLWPKDEAKRRHMLKIWLIQIKANLTEEATIEQFVEYCASNLFWPALMSTLSDARSFVENVIGGQIVSELDGLASSVQKMSWTPPGLIASINAARTDIENAAVKVSKWFLPPQLANKDASYSLKTAIEIGITSLRHIKPQFDSRMTWSVDESANVTLHSTAFQIINDVAFLIFGNIIKHSGYFDEFNADRENADIRIWIREKASECIEVEVVNEISSAKDISLIANNVSVAKDQIAAGEFDTVAKKNHKSGLVRLAATLNYEKSADRLLDFGVIRNRTFQVIFSVPRFVFLGQPS